MCRRFRQETRHNQPNNAVPKTLGPVITDNSTRSATPTQEINDEDITIYMPRSEP